MKIKHLIFIVLTFFFFDSKAQTDDYSTYLDKVREKVEAGDCEAAQKLYNVYKELTGQMSSSLEKSIADCNKQKNSKKTYSIGDDAKDFIGLEGYKIAYLDASGKHGFAIKTGRGAWGNSPTLDDCKILYRNRYSLGLTGEYWTDKEAEIAEGLIWHIHGVFRTFDFTTGKTHNRTYSDYNKNHIKRMVVERF